MAVKYKVYGLADGFAFYKKIVNDQIVEPTRFWAEDWLVYGLKHKLIKIENPEVTDTVVFCRNNDIENHEEDYDLLNEFGVFNLYHITHLGNLVSILKHGLFPHNIVRQRMTKYSISDAEVNNIRDVRKESIYGRKVNDYVPLYFNPKNPMLYKIREIDNLIILEIDRNLLLEENTIFSNGNASSQSSNFFNHVSHLKYLNWSCIYGKKWSSIDDGKRIRCAEVLVNSMIPPKYIKKIICKDEELSHLLNMILNELTSVQIVFDPKFFFDKNEI